MSAVAPQIFCFFVIFVPSWWKIADLCAHCGLSNRGLSGRQVSLVTSVIFHHEGTKIMKKKPATTAGGLRPAAKSQYRTQLTL